MNARLVDVRKNWNRALVFAFPILCDALNLKPMLLLNSVVADLGMVG